MLLPDTAERILASGETEKVEVGQLSAGDRVLIRPGASIPADGVVAEGESSVNEALIAGESLPLDKKPGDRVRFSLTLCNQYLAHLSGAKAFTPSGLTNH